MEIEALRKRVVEYVSKGLVPIRLLYLFGSQARGTTGPLSDYDLGVLLDPGSDTLGHRTQLAYDLAVVLDVAEIDLISLHDAPIELAYVVIAEGVLLYQCDLATRIEYEADVLSRYGDYLPVLRGQRKDILRGDHYAARVRWYREALDRTERALGQARASEREATD